MEIIEGLTLNNQYVFRPSVDVFAAGVTIYEMFSGTLLFQASEDGLEKLKNDEQRTNVSPAKSQSMLDWKAYYLKQEVSPTPKFKSPILSYFKFSLDTYPLH